MKRYLSEAFVAAFALLTSITAVSTYAQMPEEVSGTYTNAAAGVEITFPDGWSGASIPNEEGVFVTVAPGGMSEEAGDKAILLIAADKGEVQEAPTDPSSFSQGQDAPQCTTPTFEQTTVSGVKGVQGIIECTDDNGRMTKMKIVAAETETRWVTAVYMALTSEFDADVANFDAAVQSLKLTGAVDSQIPTGSIGSEEGMTSSMMPVMVAGEEINVSVASSSQISEFKLDEASKIISLKADSSGSTKVAVGSVLEGPYIVTVNGQPAEFEETTENGVKSVNVDHTSGAEITITGTQVVPEFPIAVIGAIAALIGIVSVLGRTKLMKGRI